MKVLEDIFVPCEIAQKLKEIGFDEPCIAYFNSTSIIPDRPYIYAKGYGKNSTESKNFTTAPTYEQVFKWFREKNYQSSIVFNLGGFYVHIEDMHKIKAFTTYGDYTSYKEAREQLILKLIEIYKDGKTDI